MPSLPPYNSFKKLFNRVAESALSDSLHICLNKLFKDNFVRNGPVFRSVYHCILYLPQTMVFFKKSLTLSLFLKGWKNLDLNYKKKLSCDLKIISSAMN